VNYCLPCTSISVLTVGDFAGSSDVQGRLAVGGNANLADGFSIGDKLALPKCNVATDTDVNNILYVGGKLTWGSGNPYSGEHTHCASSKRSFIVANLPSFLSFFFFFFR
jgi:choice-of-anchor A domain-containing protein